MAQTDQPDASKPQSEPARRRGRFGRRMLFWTGLPALAAAGFFATRAWAHGGFRGGCHHGGEKTPEEAEARLQRMVDRAMSHLDASDAQREQARAIVSRRAGDLHAVHSEGRGLRQRFLSAARADDRPELEALRKQGLDVMDRGSALWLATLQDLTDVLEPDQREALLEHLDHGPWHRMH